ncbi:hypothetical protein [Crossiella sp. CA198]|uniref:hypothetical protein n=1 Tax=Crossiella sp. CA198 TaxID=3455607 RepID=UPI003F8D5565
MSEIGWMAVMFELLAIAATIAQSRSLARTLPRTPARTKAVLWPGVGMFCFLSMASAALVGAAWSVAVGLGLFALCLAGLLLAIVMGGLAVVSRRRHHG